MFYLLAETSLPVDPSSAPSREYYLWIACCLLTVILPPDRYLQTGKNQSLLFCQTSTHFDTLLSSAHHTLGFCFLQKGNCGFNGEGCTLVETTLQNPTTAGSGSSTDLSLIPP